MKVKAVKKGYDGICIREVGDVFEYEGDVEKGSWMVPVDEAPKKVAVDDSKKSSGKPGAQDKE